MEVSDSNRTLWVIGGGSGIGRAAAAAAAETGWQVAVTGRRAEAVSQSARLLQNAGGTALEVPADARDPASLRQSHPEIVAQGTRNRHGACCGNQHTGPNLGRPENEGVRSNPRYESHQRRPGHRSCASWHEASGSGKHRRSLFTCSLAVRPGCRRGIYDE